MSGRPGDGAEEVEADARSPSGDGSTATATVDEPGSPAIDSPEGSPKAAEPPAEPESKAGSPLFDLGESAAASQERITGDEYTPDELQVHLPAFEGPLDLLLHLIRKHKINIYDIPIALITDQYHQALEAMEQLNLEVAGEFIYMAALLIHIKSRMLLPQPESGEQKEDPRQELIDRLLEYRRVKDIAEGLHELESVERGVWVRRPGTFHIADEAELPLAECSMFDIIGAFQRVLERYRLAHPPAYSVTPQRFSVKEKMIQILQRIDESEPVHLLALLSEAPTRGEIVVLFIATLELVRLHAIRAFQDGAFGEILLHKGEDALDVTAFEDSYQ